MNFKEYMNRYIKYSFKTMPLVNDYVCKILFVIWCIYCHSVVEVNNFLMSKWDSLITVKTKVSK